ncbi:MAG: WXG100 family type VII secretion target [Nocardioides sp.]
MSGMDVQAVRQLATQLKAAGDQITQLTQKLTSQLNSTTWQGSDQQRFSNDWQSQYRTSLTNVADALRQAGELANRNAQEQEQASS